MTPPKEKPALVRVSTFYRLDDPDLARIGEYAQAEHRGNISAALAAIIREWAKREKQRAR